MASSSNAKYIGYRQEDAHTPYAKYYHDAIANTQAHITLALSNSPYPQGALPPLGAATGLMKDGYAPVETGYTLEADGSARIAALTTMPGVTPAMWHWWFGWHGSQANRYKLWHPRAHLSAAWKDGGTQQAYIGRNSMIEEYIGPNLEKASIQFIEPYILGLASTPDNLFICARVGFTGAPLNFGWMVHQVRAIEGGSEMRSRFWLGGEHIQLRMDGAIANAVSKVLRKLRRVPESQVRLLLIHCGEEMNHLAGFLPQLYADMNP